MRGGRLPPPVAVLLGLLGILAAVTVQPGAVGALPHAGEIDEDANVSLGVEPRWGTATPGNWTVYGTTVTNRSGHDINGVVRLVPQGDGARAEAFPAHEARVMVAAGAEKALTFLVVEPPSGYRAELRDASGTRVTGAERPAASAGGVGVALLTDVDVPEHPLGDLREQPGAPVLAAVAARDFPSGVLSLSGLSTVVIAGFDTAQLSAAQRDTLLDFVAFGGTLVLTGGRAGSSNLRALPAELTPLVMSATATVGIAPVAGLAGQTSDAKAVVATGALRQGRSVVESPEGVPLVVEGAYGEGFVVQLAYDPLAEPFTEGRLRAAAWGPVLGLGARASTRPPPGEVGASGWDDLWSGDLAQPPAPHWPSLLTTLLLAYVVAVAGVASRVVRRRRGVRAWAGVPALAVFLAVAVTAGGRSSAIARATVLEVNTLGASGTVVTESYHRFFAGASEGALQPVSAASTVYTNHFPLGPFVTGDARIPGTGGGTIVHSGTAVLQVRLPSARPVTVQTLTAGQQSLGLAAHLKVVGASTTFNEDSQTNRSARGRGRLTGQVVNQGSTRLRHLVAALPGGRQVILADVLAPGQALTVDVSLAGPNPTSANRPGAEALSVAAARPRARSGRMTLVSSVEDASRTRTGGTAVRVLVQPLDVDITTDLVGVEEGQGRRLVAAVPPDGMRPWVRVYDLPVPPGRQGQPLWIVASSVDQVEIYDWITGTWRLASRGFERRIGPDEQTPGVVRVRVLESPRPASSGEGGVGLSRSG